MPLLDSPRLVRLRASRERDSRTSSPTSSEMASCVAREEHFCQSRISGIPAWEYFVLTSLTTVSTMPRRTSRVRSSQTTSHDLSAKSSLQRSPVARPRDDHRAIGFRELPDEPLAFEGREHPWFLLALASSPHPNEAHRAVHEHPQKVLQMLFRLGASSSPLSQTSTARAFRFPTGIDPHWGLMWFTRSTTTFTVMGVRPESSR
jgi:hypothetical protein